MDLHHEIKDRLAKLSVISETSAASLEGKVSTGEGDYGNCPPGPNQSAYDRVLRAYRKAMWSDTRLALVLDLADAELHAARFSRRRIDGTTHEGRLQIATHPGSPQHVAEVFGVPVEHVYRMREWARRQGLLIEDGRRAA